MGDVQPQHSSVEYVGGLIGNLCVRRFCVFCISAAATAGTTAAPDIAELKSSPLSSLSACPWSPLVTSSKSPCARPCCAGGGEDEDGAVFTSVAAAICTSGSLFSTLSPPQAGVGGGTVRDDGIPTMPIPKSAVTVLGETIVRSAQH